MVGGAYVFLYSSSTLNYATNKAPLQGLLTEFFKNNGWKCKKLWWIMGLAIMSFVVSNTKMAIDWITMELVP